MRRTPLVSVVVPTYNQPALLIETLDSVFAQTLADFEVIVVNDGSTDDTLERLRTPSWSRDERLRVVTQPNAGIGPARDRGIGEAVGKYVALLDHDDLWMPGKLQAQVELFERHPRLVACSVPFARSTTPTIPAFDVHRLGAVDGVIERPLRPAGAGSNFHLTSVLMFDREKARGLRHGRERGATEDMPFQIGLLARGPFGIAGDGILALYRVHSSNFSNSVEYHVRGVRLLREMDRAGAFGEVAPEDRAHLLKLLAGLGRGAAVGDLMLGSRRRAMATYSAEVVHQWRQRRLGFVFGFPAMACIPAALIRTWSTRGARCATRDAGPDLDRSGHRST